MKLQIEDKEKVEILRQLLPQFWNETIHWREDSWKFTQRLIASIVILPGLSIASQKGAVFVSLILLALSTGGTIYLVKNYRNYIDRRKLFMRLEEALLLFEDNAYLEGQSVLPKELLTKKPNWTGTRVYIFLVWIVALAAWAAMWLTSNP